VEGEGSDWLQMNACGTHISLVTVFRYGSHCCVSVSVPERRQASRVGFVLASTQASPKHGGEVGCNQVGQDPRVAVSGTDANFGPEPHRLRMARCGSMAV
jgi:hypothetical protein